jgi:hypothetical protein
LRGASGEQFGQVDGLGARLMLCDGYCLGDILFVGQDGKNFGERKISGKNATRLEVGAVDANNPFSLVFISRGGAKLYSFWTGGADGRSGGYLAGGSPESATLRDDVK